MTEAATDTRTAEEIARASFAAYAAGDVEALLDHWHRDGVQYWVPLGVFRGHDEIRRLNEEIRAAMPDFELIADHFVADGRRCAVQWRSRGTHTGAAFAGVEPTGRSIELQGCDVMEVEDGLLVRNTVYFDGAAFARGLGMLPPQDSGAERAMIAAFNGLTKLRRAIAERTGGTAAERS